MCQGDCIKTVISQMLEDPQPWTKLLGHFAHQWKIFFASQNEMKNTGKMFHPPSPPSNVGKGCKLQISKPNLSVFESNIAWGCGGVASFYDSWIEKRASVPTGFVQGCLNFQIVSTHVWKVVVLLVKVQELSNLLFRLQVVVLRLLCSFYKKYANELKKPGGNYSLVKITWNYLLL